jgi:hypothetical protein
MNSGKTGIGGDPVQMGPYLRDCYFIIPLIYTGVRMEVPLPSIFPLPHPYPGG